MNQQRVIKCIVLTVILCSTNILFIYLPFDVEGSYDSPRMEVENNGQWTQKAGTAGDNQIDLKIITKYINPNAATRILPGAYFEVIDCSDQSVKCTGYTGADGTAHAFPGVPNLSIKEFKIKVYMGNSDGGVCGKVVDSNSNLYYGITSSRVCLEAKDYDCLLKFKDSGDAGDSFVGAAAIYTTIFYSKKLVTDNIVDNDVTNGDIKINFYWPYQGASKFVPKSGQNPSKVYIDGNYFIDGDWQTWTHGYDSVKHQHAHVIHYEIGYEENYWPSGTTSDLVLWHKEKSTSPSGTEMEWAFVDGFADFWAAYADVIDNNPLPPQDDIVFFDITTHIETDIWYQLRYIGDTTTGIRGERTEGFIANLLWDIVDDNTFPNFVGDEECFISVNNLWTVININSVYSILDVWDHCMYQPFFPGVAALVKLEYLFLFNNVGRHQYASYSNAFETDDDLEFSSFEIWGMNPSPPQVNQRILGRYVLKNVGQSSVTFDDVQGIDVKSKDPNANTVAFGSKYIGFTLNSNEKIMETAVCTVNNPNAITYDWIFWPHYTLENANEAADFDDTIARTVTIKDQIWSETFQGAWPGVWSTGEDSQTNPTYLWDRVQFAGPGGNPNYCPWCAGIDSNGNSRNPNQGPPFLNYMDDQATYIYTESNWRYIGLRVHWDMWLDVAAQNLNDKVVLRTFDGTNMINIATYTKVDNTNGNWKGFWANMPTDAFKNGEDTRIDWYFLSDLDQNIARGAFVDEIYLNTDNRP